MARLGIVARAKNRGIVERRFMTASLSVLREDCEGPRKHVIEAAGGAQGDDRRWLHPPVVGDLIGRAQLARKIPRGKDGQPESAVLTQLLHHDRAGIADGEPNLLGNLPDGTLLDGLAGLYAPAGKRPQMLVWRIGALD